MIEPLAISVVRRIFPTLQFSLEGLEKNRFYTVCVDVLQVGVSQWKYQSSRWVQSGKAHRPLPSEFRFCITAYFKATINQSLFYYAPKSSPESWPT